MGSDFLGNLHIDLYQSGHRISGRLGRRIFIRVSVSGNLCSGHFTEGFSHFISDDGSPTGQQIESPYGNNSMATSIPIRPYVQH
jgi:hypothetical protein